MKNGVLSFNGCTIWNSCNDGHNSGLDADLLDGQHADYYAIASDYVKKIGDTWLGPMTLTDASYFIGNPNYGVRFNSNDNAYNNFIIYDNGNAYVRGNLGIGVTS
jgi:hypothetical protein